MQKQSIVKYAAVSGLILGVVLLGACATTVPVWPENYVTDDGRWAFDFISEEYGIFNSVENGRRSFDVWYDFNYTFDGTSGITITDVRPSSANKYTKDWYRMPPVKAGDIIDLRGSPYALAKVTRRHSSSSEGEGIGTLSAAAAPPDRVLGSVEAGVSSAIADEMQWLSVQIACIGMYNNAQAGNYTLGDPRDCYTPPDIRDYLTRASGDRTRTATFYGICFDYAQAAYDEISRNRSRYESLGMQRNKWYIAAVKDSSRQIILYDPVSQEQASDRLNGVYLKENSRQNVQAHGNGTTWHAWLWLYGNDGMIYWIDPTWTDNTGYVWWGIVQDGKEVQCFPAEELCKSAIPSDAAFAYFNRGSANKNQGRGSQAINDYNEALRLNPASAETLFNRGTAYYDEKMFDRAIADFNAALRINPDLIYAYNNRGNAYNAKGMYDQAIADYNAAIGIDPNDALPYSNRGNAYNAKGMYDQAIADYNAALRINPNYADAYNNRGLVYSANKMYSQAIADYNAALRINPNYADAYTNRGVAYNAKGMYDQAIADCNAALRIDPDNDSAYINRSVAYHAKGMYDQAIADCNAALTINPNDAMAYSNRGAAYHEKGMYDQAIADYSAALRINPNYATPYNNRGLVYSHNKMYSQAIADYNAALRINPNYADAYTNRGIAYYWIGDHTRARADWRQALRLNPNDTVARNNLANY